MNFKRFTGVLAVATMALAGLATPAYANGAVPISKPFTAVEKPTPTKDDKPTKGFKGNKGLPKPGGGSKTRAASPATPGYWYAGAHQYVTTNGLYANCNTRKPFIEAAKDAHTLCEIAVQSADGNQAVEIGWRVAPYTNGGSNEPFLFVYHWVNDIGQGYNGFGFVDYAPNTLDAGDQLSVTPGVNTRFGIEYFSGNWWVGVDLGGGAGFQWVGYFPATLWSNATPSVTFTQGGLVQGFGEVNTQLTADDYPCTDMGTGINGSTSVSTDAQVGTAALVSGSAAMDWSITSQAYNSPTGPYSAAKDSSQTISFGGPGHNSIDGLPGSTGSCAPAAEGVPAASSLQVWKEACPDGAAVTGCNSAWSAPWSTAVVNQCHAVPANVEMFRRVWNNSLSSGKSFYVYASGSCGATRTLVTNASKLVTAWDIHGWARAS